jgi:ankyrin repeat protein
VFIKETKPEKIDIRSCFSLSLFEALHYAAQVGNLEIVKILIDHKINVNALTKDNLLPLYVINLSSVFTKRKKSIKSVGQVICFILSFLSNTFFFDFHILGTLQLHINMKMLSLYY